MVDLYLMASLLDDYSSKRCKVGSQQPAGATDHYSTHAEASLQKATSDLARCGPPSYQMPTSSLQARIVEHHKCQSLSVAIPLPEHAGFKPFELLGLVKR